MDQENTAESGAVEPRSLWDTARPESVETTHAEPAGRQEPMAMEETAGETGDSPQALPEGQDGRARDPVTGKFIQKPEAAPEATGSPPAQQQSEPPQHVPVAVLVEERKRRQALERELAEYRSRPAAQPQVAPQHQAPPVPMQDLMFQDPERFIQTLQQQRQEELVHTRIALSEAQARQNPDYEDAEKALHVYSRQNPRAAEYVANMLWTHPAPGIWAYQFGKKLIAQQRWQPIMQQHGDPEAYVNAEVERRMAERMQQQPATPTARPTAPPASLATARSVGQRGNASTFTGPRPLFPSGR